MECVRISRICGLGEYVVLMCRQCMCFGRIGGVCGLDSRYMWIGRTGSVCGLDEWAVYVAWIKRRCMWFRRAGGVCGFEKR